MANLCISSGLLQSNEIALNVALNQHTPELAGMIDDYEKDSAMEVSELFENAILYLGRGVKTYLFRACWICQYWFEYRNLESAVMQAVRQTHPSFMRRICPLSV